MATVVITGGTGLVGSHLCTKLKEKGYKVYILSRTKHNDSGIPSYTWDLDKGELQREAIEKADYIIHLAGANIASRRWTNRRKQLIIDSRILTGRLIYEKLKGQKKHALKAFISASAIGYYGTLTSDKIFNESDPPSDDFLGNTCKQWEQMTDQFKDLEVRTVKIRTGVVLAQQGGALSKITAPIKLGVGSAIGSGRQYLPWIHIDDLCGIYIKAIEDKQMHGAYNAVAPSHTTNKAFTQTIARTLNKPLWVPNIPTIAMNLLFGYMAQMLLKGSRVSAGKIIAEGYHFLFPDLESALNDILNK